MLPNTLPGQGVIMVIVGNTSLSNDTIAGQTTTPADPIPATATANANLRSAPHQRRRHGWNRRR